MSKLMHQRSGRTHLLAPTNVVGRSPTSDLSLPFTAAAVSRFHALIYWAEGQEERGWWVRDLNSRNGTFVDGKHILPGRDVKLAENGTVAFGARNDTWMLQVAESPPLILIGRRPDHEVRLIGRAFLLPHDDIPEVMIQRRRGIWVFSTIEAPEDERPLDADRPFIVGETEWRAIVPGASGQTHALPGGIVIVLVVSQDEEYVQVFAERGANRERIAHGTGNALAFLLFLVRQRLVEAEKGIPEPEQGWIHTVDAADMLRCTELVLNQWVFRIRKKFADAGLDDIDVIERRARTGLLRFGHATVRVE